MDTPGRAHPNALRFPADLKAGNNEILVQIGKVDCAWMFCLREVSPKRVIEIARAQTENGPKPLQARERRNEKRFPTASNRTATEVAERPLLPGT